MGSVLYDTSRSVVADMVVKAGDLWLVVEVKNSTPETSTQKFLKAVGQSVGYTSLFQREWSEQVQSVGPVVIQESVPVIGEAYRSDRYNNHHGRMLRAALQDRTQPWVYGPAESFGPQ